MALWSRCQAILASRARAGQSPPRRHPRKSCCALGLGPLTLTAVSARLAWRVGSDFHLLRGQAPGSRRLPAPPRCAASVRPGTRHLGCPARVEQNPSPDQGRVQGGPSWAPASSTVWAWAWAWQESGMWGLGKGRNSVYTPSRVLPRGHKHSDARGTLGRLRCSCCWGARERTGGGGVWGGGPPPVLLQLREGTFKTRNYSSCFRRESLPHPPLGGVKGQEAMLAPHLWAPGSSNLSGFGLRVPTSFADLKTQIPPLLLLRKEGAEGCGYLCVWGGGGRRACGPGRGGRPAKGRRRVSRSYTSTRFPSPWLQKELELLMVQDKA